MSSSIDSDKACSVRNDMAGIFTCRGCRKHFCLHHTTEHRLGLQRSMDDIVQQCEDLRKNFGRRSNEENKRVLIQKVDQWRTESIKKVNQLAKDIQQQLSDTVYERSDKLKHRLEELDRQLSRARRDGGFFEDDIANWHRMLVDLRGTIEGYQGVRFDDDAGAVPFIARISINDTYSDERPRQQRPPTDDFRDYRHPEDQGEYYTGSNIIRFHLAQYDPSNPALFGVVSKERNTRSQDPEKNLTFYGWTDKDRLYEGGKFHRDTQEYRTDFQQDDILELGLDCNRKRITLKNERTNQSSVIRVHPDVCPFPWQLNVRLLDRPE